MNLIGLSGKKRSGKDTAFSIAKEVMGDRAVRVAFADALKLELAEALVSIEDYMGVSQQTRLKEHLANMEDDEMKIHYRLMLQGLGQFRRQFWHPDWWINQAREEIETYRDTDKFVFVTDVRYLNEVKMIKELGGRNYRILRPELVDEDNHSSEIELDSFTDWDLVLLNNDLDTYKRDLTVLMEDLLSG